MPTPAQTYASQLTDLLKANALAEGAELKGDLQAAELYTANTILPQLSLALAQPGYQEALVAARDDVALKYAGLAVDAADALDARIVGIVQGALGIASRALIVA